MNKQIYINFDVGFSNSIDKQPDSYFEATVPGAVQLDFANAHNLPPYYYSENWKSYQWMEDVFWHYRAYINLDKIDEEKQIFLRAKGIDYKYVVKVNNTVLLEHEGMFSPIEINLTEYQNSAMLLEIIIYPAPKASDYPVDRSQARYSCKPAVSYGWDWHPRLIPLGIWDEIYIEYRDSLYIKNAEIQYELINNYNDARIELLLEASLSNYSYLINISDPDNREVLQKSGVNTAEKLCVKELLNDIKLWWPNGYGSPSLYNAKIRIYRNEVLTDEKTFRIGFRQVELTMYDGGWDEPRIMPKSRSLPPVLMRVNGMKIFCKGSNWVQPEIFYGTLNEEKYRKYIELAKEANFNILRCWGGGVINKDSFFSICDEIGILVWQEFPLACNKYPDDEGYLKTLDQESRAVINRIKTHPCLALWCGGNELFNAWSRMSEQSLPLRLLNKNCLELDKKTPFILTSPLEGMAHGGYVFLDDDNRDIYSCINSASNTAYTEFSCPSISNMDILRLALPEDELKLPIEGNSWISHHGFNAWTDNTWVMQDVIEHYFGKAKNLDELISNSNRLQCEGLKAIFEEARKQQPKCSMALNWCFCEPWPTAAGNNIVTWTGGKKPAYYAVKDALRETMTSARNSKFIWSEGEYFSSEIWVLNDSLAEKTIGEIKVTIELGGTKYELLRWKVEMIPAQTNIKGPTAYLKLPESGANEMLLHIEVTENPEYNSDYYFRYKAKEKYKAEDITPRLNV